MMHPVQHTIPLIEINSYNLKQLESPHLNQTNERLQRYIHEIHSLGFSHLKNVPISPNSINMMPGR